jgi:hypothetical protein
LTDVTLEKEGRNLARQAAKKRIHKEKRKQKRNLDADCLSWLVQLSVIENEPARTTRTKKIKSQIS